MGQKGLIQILALGAVLALVAGLGAAIYLVQHQTNTTPKAVESGSTNNNLIPNIPIQIPSFLAGLIPPPPLSSPPPSAAASANPTPTATQEGVCRSVDCETPRVGCYFTGPHLYTSCDSRVPTCGTLVCPSPAPTPTPAPISTPKPQVPAATATPVPVNPPPPPPPPPPPASTAGCTHISYAAPQYGCPNGGGTICLRNGVITCTPDP